MSEVMICEKIQERLQSNAIRRIIPGKQTATHQRHRLGMQALQQSNTTNTTNTAYRRRFSERDAGEQDEITQEILVNANTDVETSALRLSEAMRRHRSLSNRMSRAINVRGSTRARHQAEAAEMDHLRALHDFNIQFRAFLQSRINRGPGVQAGGAARAPDGAAMRLRARRGHTVAGQVRSLRA